jgi:hypothetical protein
MLCYGFLNKRSLLSVLRFFVEYVSIWQSTLSQTVVALAKMMSCEFIYACFD